jgi:tetratricopeptide (TPR) repeat protein
MPSTSPGPSVDLQSFAAPPREVSKRPLILCLALAAMTLLIYNRASLAHFLNFDDPQYVINNAHVRQGITWDAVRWSFSAYEAGNWHPLTWLSHALDVQLFQLNPAGHHYVNVIFHAVNAVLLFLLLLSATRRTWMSWLVAALWAIHPVNVESVAWIAERKNVLSMFFLLLAMHAYGRYVTHPKVGRYAAMTLLFALGLMAKPQIITLPFVLLLWDYWPLQRDSGAHHFLGRLVLEKLPLFLLSGISAWITVHAQRLGHAVRTVSEFPISARVENALVSYVRYIQIAFWPERLAPIYPHPESSIPLWRVAAAIAILGLVTGLAVWQRQRRFLPAGWFWFLGTMVPMIGLVQVGQQAMADRYAYLPYIGLLLMVVWGAGELLAAGKVSSTWPTAVSAVVLIALAVATYRQTGFWRDSETLWTRALAVTEKNYTAHGNLADALAQQGRSDEAIVHFEAAARLHMYQPAEVLALARYEQQNGHLEDAIEQFKRVLRSPDPQLRRDALDHLGFAYMQRGNQQLAKESYAQALQIAPDDPVALVGIGLASYPGNPELAAAQFSRAVTVAPSDVGFLLLAAALQKAGRTVESQAAYKRARQMSPDLTQAQEAADRLLRDAPGISN